MKLKETFFVCLFVCVFVCFGLVFVVVVVVLHIKPYNNNIYDHIQCYIFIMYGAVLKSKAHC